MSDSKSVSEVAKDAKNASLVIQRLKTDVKNQALLDMAQSLRENVELIVQANKKDLDYAERESLPKPIIARLSANEKKVLSMAQGLESVAGLPDPVGREHSAMALDEGLVLRRVSCPIGVIGAIFESRPDAVPQIASLCLKSGNAVILKGGAEAEHSNRIIVELLVAVLGKHGIPPAAIQLIETREEVREMLDEDRLIDLVIPRGSNAFVRFVQDNTKIPVLGHSEGVCHVYVDTDADFDMATNIALDSKLQYAAACNAMETLLIHEDLKNSLAPRLIEAFREKEVEIHGCPETMKLAANVIPVKEGEWSTEYNDFKLTVRIVESLDKAVEHINEYGSGHTDTIVTNNHLSAERFLDEVDAASVMWNASTRFADGFRYGLGAEVGISTNKTHARGPVGLEGLVIYKYLLRGDGQIVDDYASGSKQFKHKPL